MLTAMEKECKLMMHSKNFNFGKYPIIIIYRALKAISLSFCPVTTAKGYLLKTAVQLSITYCPLLFIYT